MTDSNATLRGQRGGGCGGGRVPLQPLPGAATSRGVFVTALVFGAVFVPKIGFRRQVAHKAKATAGSCRDRCHYLGDGALAGVSS